MKKNIILLALISFILIALNDLTKAILELNLLLYNSLSEKFTSAQILEIFEMQDKWLWVSYLFIPIYLFFKTIIIASIVYTGIFMFNKRQVHFKLLWHEVLKGNSYFFWYLF